MMGVLDSHALLWLFGFAFASDLLRAGFELAVNFYFRGRCRPTVSLNPQDVAIVIPCHNSAASIEATLHALPERVTVYCVANNCSDATADIVRAIGKVRDWVRLIDVDYAGRGKTKAALLGALQASKDGFTHFLLLDDDVLWPQGRPIEVMDKTVAVTAVPVMPAQQNRLLERFQLFEYIGTNLNKRCQTYFADDVTWASGAAAIYRLDVYLEVMRQHDGEFAGEDIQCSYLHHHSGYTIDFLPETIVTTVVPRSPSEWWRQRAHSWDVSFMFLHLGLLLRVLFRTGGAGAGWWIRLLTFYRIYDALLVVVKLGLPFAVLEVPTVALFFVSSSYAILAVQYLSYPLFFPPLDRPKGANTQLAVAFVTFPAYMFTTWVSRLAAVPRVVYLKLHRRPPLGAFVDQGFAACSRVGGFRVIGPGATYSGTPRWPWREREAASVKANR